MKSGTMIKSTLHVMQDVYHGMKVYLVRVSHIKLIVVEEEYNDKRSPKKREKMDKE